MKPRRIDFLVGIFVLVSVGVMIGALLLTSGFGEGRYNLFLRSQTARSLSPDTKVILRGLVIGRVTEINPVTDPTSGDLSFVSKLSIQENYPDGTTLTLPTTTSAVIAQPSPIAGAVIEFVIPAGTARRGVLVDGDTLTAERSGSAVDALTEMARSLSVEVPRLLREAQDMIDAAEHTVSDAGSFISTTRPEIKATLRQVSRTLANFEVLAKNQDARLGELQDSLAFVLSDARGMLQRFDSLATMAETMSEENRGLIHSTMQSISRSTEVLSHFAEQISRRPLRMLTGVKPPPDRRDSTEHRQ
ncbi:MAG: MlaD family protein [Gemmatimonadales bacterium]